MEIGSALWNSKKSIQLTETTFAFGFQYLLFAWLMTGVQNDSFHLNMKIKVEFINGTTFF